MKIHVETSVTLHIDDKHYLKKVASLEMDHYDIISLLSDGDTSKRATGNKSNIEITLLDTVEIAEAFEMANTFVADSVWSAIEEDLDVLDTG